MKLRHIIIEETNKEQLIAALARIAQHHNLSDAADLLRPLREVLARSPMRRMNLQLHRVNLREMTLLALLRCPRNRKHRRDLVRQLHQTIECTQP